MPRKSSRPVLVSRPCLCSAMDILVKLNELAGIFKLTTDKPIKYLAKQSTRDAILKGGWFWVHLTDARGIQQGRVTLKVDPGGVLKEIWPKQYGKPAPKDRHPFFHTVFNIMPYPQGGNNVF